MKKENNLFDRLASDILSRSQSTSNQNHSGTNLYAKFCNLLYSKYKLAPNEQKLITVFYKGRKNLFSIETQVSTIKITLNAKHGTLKDERNLLRDVSKIGHWGSGDYQIKLDSDEHFDYLIELLKQII